MSKTEQAPTLGADRIRRGLVAAAIAWLLPGAGHFYLGARRRAAVFLIVVVATVGLGIACDGNLAVIDPGRAPVLSGLQVFGNLAIGPVEPVIRYSLYGGLVYRLPTSSAPALEAARRAALDRRAERTERRFSLYGTAYVMAAGLMNLLLMLDAWDIGIGRRP